MQNNVDYIYEYSDLNELHTRAEILTGEYAGIVVEFGNSFVLCDSEVPGGQWNFEYTVYKLPESLKDLNTTNAEFQYFLSRVLLNIIQDRRADEDEHDKLMEAASASGVKTSKIKINEAFYQQKKLNNNI